VIPFIFKIAWNISYFAIEAALQVAAFISILSMWAS